MDVWKLPENIQMKSNIKHEYIYHKKYCSSLLPLKCQCLPPYFPPGEKLLCICFTPLPFQFMRKFRAPNETTQCLRASFRNGSQAGCQWSMLVAKVERMAAIMTQITAGAIMFLDNYT